jgi:hypothetical protein
MKSAYGSRDARLDEVKDFFDGDQWEQEEADLDEEDVRVTLNYARRAVLWHVAYLTQQPPRVDVQTSPAKPDPSANRREKFLRAVASNPAFLRAHRRAEMSANKYGYGVLQVLWTPPDGQPKSKELSTTEGSTAAKSAKVYTQMPFAFRALNPRKFYPRYRTYDRPDDFLYVFRHDPDRLVEDIEDKYGVSLAPTSTMASTPGGTCDLVEYWDDERYKLMAITQELVAEGEGRNVATRVEETIHVLEEKKNPYKRPPFFVLPNVVADPDADPTDEGSLSEVELIKDTNKHLNLLMSLTATEIAKRIHPPVAYKSDDHQQADVRLGAGEVIPIGADEDLEPLTWSGIPQTVAEYRNALMQAMRDLSGLPKTSFGEGDAQGASGVGMRLAYAALELVLALKIPERVEFLTGIFEFVLEAAETQLKENAQISLWSTGEVPVQVVLEGRDIGGSHQCTVRYGNLIPRNRVEWEQHVVYLYKTGVISHYTALELLEDVADPKAEIERIRVENKDVALHPDIAKAIKEFEQQSPPAPSAPQPGGPEQGLKFNAAPPVPTFPSTPTQQNAPFLQRGQVPNMGQLGQRGGMGPGFGPGVNVGPPMETMG